MTIVILLTGVLLALSVPGVAVSESLSVEVRSAKLRAAPRTWSPPVADLSYGDRIDVVARSDGWVRGRTPTAEGYIHATALTARQVVLAEGSMAFDPTAEGAGVVLAGKGFAESVESQTSLADPALNFEGVDQLERFTVESNDLRQFLIDGELSVPKGDS